MSLASAPARRPGLGKAELTAALFLGIIVLAGMRQAELPRVLFYGPAFIAALFYFVEARLPRPAALGCLLAAYLPFGRQLAYDTGALPSPAVVVPAVCLLMLISSVFQEKRLPSWDDYRSAPLMAFSCFLAAVFLGCAVSVAGGADPKQILRELIGRWLSFFLIFAAVTRSIRTRDDAGALLRAATAAVTAVSLLAVFQMMVQGDMHDIESARVGGVENDPNVLATLITYGFFIPAAWFLGSVKKRWPVLFVLGILVRVLLGTFSRGGYLALAVGLYVTAFFRKKRYLAVLLVLSLGIFLKPELLPESMRARLMQTFEKPVVTDTVDGVEKSLDRSNRDRIEIWRGTIRMIGDHPLLGVGYAQFRNRIAEYWYARKPFDAHNTYLFTAAEMGIPALLLFLWLHAALAFSALRLRASKDPFLHTLGLGFLGALACMMTSYLYVIRLDALESAGLFWLLAAVTARMDALTAGGTRHE